MYRLLSLRGIHGLNMWSSCYNHIIALTDKLAWNGLWRVRQPNQWMKCFKYNASSGKHHHCNTMLLHDTRLWIVKTLSITTWNGLITQPSSIPRCHLVCIIWNYWNDRVLVLVVGRYIGFIVLGRAGGQAGKCGGQAGGRAAERANVNSITL